MPRRDFITSLFLVLLGSFVAWQSFRMPTMRERGHAIFEAPGLLPAILGFLLVICGALLLTRSVRADGWRLRLGPLIDRGLWKTGGFFQLAAALLFIVVYAVVLVDWIPFWMATILFVFAFIAFFEWQPALSARRRARRLGTALLQAVLVAGAVTLLFERVFLIYLPG
jgi:hypothetical protein